MRNPLVIKRLCLANGDEYQAVTLDIHQRALREAMAEGATVALTVGDKTVVINTEYIVSFEVDKARALVVV